MRPIIFGNDHAGFEYKTQLLTFLDKNDHCRKIFSRW